MLSDAKVVVVRVCEHVRHEVPLGNQLLHVRRVALAVLPRLWDAVESAVGVVELASLQMQEEAREGLEPQEPVECECGGGVVSAVVERRDLIVLPRLEALLEEGATRRVERSNWL